MSNINQDLFIAPHCNFQKGDADLMTAVNLSKRSLVERWQTPGGKYILSTWKGNKFERKVLDGLVGKFYDHTDIRGIPLAGEDLSGVDLAGVDFYGADLRGANFNAANLSGSWMSEARIGGTWFDWAKMDGVLLDMVDFDGKTSFVGVNLNAVNFTLAALVQDLAVSQQRVAHLEKRHPVLAAVLRVTCDYGRSLRRFVALSGLVMAVFGGLYAFVPGALSKAGIWSGLYFSIATFMTLGVDVQAASAIGKILALVEAMIGYAMTGLLIAILVRRTIGD